MSDPTPFLIQRYERVLSRVPKLTRDEFGALTEVLAVWFQIKAESEPRWTDEQRQCLRQLDPDIWHSALLWRMLGERKPPLPEPPPLENSYPVYPKDDDVPGT